MRKISIVVGIVATVALFGLMSGGAVASTETQVEWDGAEKININVENPYSDVKLDGWSGSPETLSGEFGASESYERVHGWVDAEYDYGGYEFTNTTLEKNTGTDIDVGAYTEGESGFIQASTRGSRTHTGIKPKYYGGIWSGTDEAMVYTEEGEVGAWADNPNFHASVGAFSDDEVGVGTWKAGSNDVVTGSGNWADMDALVKGSGNGGIWSSWSNASVDMQVEWN